MAAISWGKFGLWKYATRHVRFSQLLRLTSMLAITADSHLDHGLTVAHLRHVLAHFHDRTSFFLLTLELPPELPKLLCGLYGPLMGDPPILDAEATLEPRPGRAWPSRLVDRPLRPSRLLTVVAGPHEDIPCLLYTAYAGPEAPREPGDTTLSPEARQRAQEFWATHALSNPRLL
jgi:hypothetical protein